MAIMFLNEIEDRKDVRNVVGAVHMASGRCKHTGHIHPNQQDAVQWGLFGSCDNKLRDVSVKVNIKNGPDAHPLIHDVKSGDTVVVRYDPSKQDGGEVTHPFCNLTASYYVGSHRGYYLEKR